MILSNVKMSVSNILDVVTIVILGLSILLVKYFVNPIERGFFCSDETLYYPFLPSTISTTVNVAVSYCIPVLILLGHALARHFSPKSKVPLYSDPKKNDHTWNSNFPGFWEEVKNFFFGVLTTQAISGVTKQMSGRLRPNFMSACQPSVPLTPEVCGSWHNPVYITNYTCLGNEEIFPDPGHREKYAREARLSFLSGHASLACFSMLYCVLYLHRVCKINYRLQSGLCQVLLLLYASGVSISRVTDNKHHVTDVLAGAVLGCSLATVVFFTGRTGHGEERKSQWKEHNMGLERTDQRRPETEGKRNYQSITGGEIVSGGDRD